jgi:flavorubredoxin
MPQISRTYCGPKDIVVKIAEIYDGISRISGFDGILGITFNQFLIDDKQPMLIHTGPIGMYKKIEEKVKEVIPLQKLTYVVFLHFKSDIVIKMGRVGFEPTTPAMSRRYLNQARPPALCI